MHFTLSRLGSAPITRHPHGFLGGDDCSCCTCLPACLCKEQARTKKGCYKGRNDTHYRREALSLSAFWYVLRMAAAMYSISLFSASNMFWVNQTASSQSRSFSGHRLFLLYVSMFKSFLE